MYFIFSYLQLPHLASADRSKKTLEFLSFKNLHNSHLLLEPASNNTISRRYLLPT